MTIHIATVHWYDETWLDIQLAYIERHLDGRRYRLYAFLNGIEPEKYRQRIDYIRTDPITAHAEKLNLLAAHICENAPPEDVIYFIDGDAFPVGDIAAFTGDKLRDCPLVAIQRPENGGDPQPHPSFCATTVGFWRDISGDWKAGPKWKNITGDYRSDVGGRLWDKLNRRGIAWHPMLRSNTIDLHPLWFGVYGGLIYHHGAGFRTPACVIDRYEVSRNPWRRLLLAVAYSRFGNIGNYWMRNAIYSFAMKHRVRRNLENSRRIVRMIQNDPHFVELFRPSPR